RVSGNLEKRAKSQGIAGSPVSAGTSRRLRFIRSSMPAKSKSPGHARASPRRLNFTLAWRYRSQRPTLSDLAERPVHAALDRLVGVGRDLLRQRAELLALFGEGLELLARMGARQLDHFRQGFRRDQLAGKIERGVGVHACRLDDLQPVVGGAFGRRRIGGLENV